MSNRELKIIIKADGSLAAEEIDKVSKELTDLGKDATKTGHELDKVDKELTDLGKGAEKTSRELDKVDKEITDLGKDSNRTGQELDKVGKELTDLGQESQRSGQQLSQTIRIIVQSANASKQASQGASQLSRSLETTAQKSSFLDRALGKIGQSLKSAGSEMRSFQSEIGEFTFAANQTLELLEKVSRYAQMGWNFAKQGAQLRESKDAFDDYARSIGKSSDDILNKLRRTSGGTIDDFNLIKTASLAMSLGVTTDSTKMANLLEIARNKARLFGIGTQQAFEDVVTGIGRASPKILDNLGIRIPAAFEEMTEGMSDAQKVAVLFEMTLKEGNAQLEGMGGMADSDADSFRRLEASWKNLKETGGELVSNVLVPINNALAIGMDGASGLLRELNKLFDYIANLDQEAPIAGMTEGELLELLAENQQLYKNYKSGWAKTLKDIDSPANSYKTSGSLGASERLAVEMQNKFFEQNMLAMDKRLATINKELERRSKNAVKELEKPYSVYSGILSSGFATGLPGFDPLSTRAKTKEEIELAKNEEKELEKQKREAESRQRELKREIENQDKKAVQILQEAAKSFNSIFGGKAVSDFKEANKYMLDLTYAAAGFVVNVKDGTTEVGKWLNEIKKIEQQEESLRSVVDLLNTIKNHDFLKTAANLNPDNTVGAAVVTTSAMDFLSGGMLSAQGKKVDETVKKKIKEIENPLADTIARSISDGFARADFSGFLRSLGGGLSSVVGGVLTDTIQSAISGRNTGTLASGNNILGGLFKPVYNKSGSLNMGALGQNLAVGAAFSFLTSPGRLFGGSVVKGQESFNTSSSLNDQVNQAKELRDQLFLQAGISEVTRQLLSEAEFYYAWVRKTKSGNGITSKKTTTYLLEGSGQAQSSIDNIKNLQEAVLSEQAQRNYSLFQVGRGDSIKALEMAVSDAASASNAAWATNMSKSELNVLNAQLQDLYRQRSQTRQTYTGGGGVWGGGNWQINAISNQIAELEQKIRDGYSYKYSEAERTGMQQQYEQAKIDLTMAKESGRTNLMQTFFGSSTMASFATSDMMKKLLGDSAIGSDSQMIQSMLPLLKQAGLADFDLAKMMLDAGSDPEKQFEAGKKQKEYLEKAASVYEQLWKDAEQEALNASLSIEQQKAAFERFQAAQSSFLEVKEQILQQEQELAAIEKQKLESKRIANIESALSLVGEMNARQNGVVIIQAGDSSAAIKELMAEFADNPEVTAILQSTLEKTEAKTRWGN